MKSLLACSLLLAVPLLSACSGVPILPGLLPYKMEIQQGNFVTQEMVSRLKPGMTRDQVRFIMGTPLHAESSGTASSRLQASSDFIRFFR